MSLRLRFIIPFLFVSSLAFAGEDWTPQPIGPFAGINNRDSSFAIPGTNAQDALNVNITPGGKSVFKRKGFGLAYTLTITTSPVHGTYTFFDSNGNTVDLFANDTYLSGSVSGASPTVIFSTGPNGATYQCTDTLGFAYCANTSRTTLIKTNGVTYSQISNVASTGTMVATAVTRLAMAGFSDRPSGIDFSADSDFTTWGTGSLGNSAVQLTVSAPGSKITGIIYAFGRLIWFKDSSFGYVLLGNQPLQTDWVIRTVSYDVGTNDNSFVFREGILYFRGQDGHIYGFDGNSYQRASREISGTISISQSRTSNSWQQTSLSDFQAGAQSPAGWLSTATISNSVVLASNSASSFLDTVSTDFAAGFSLVNIDTTTFPNSMILQVSSVSVKDQYYPAIVNEDQLNTCVTGGVGGWAAQSFTATTSYFSVQVTARLLRQGTIGNHTISIYSDSSGNPGSSLWSATLQNSDVTTSTTDISVVVSSISILASTTYWIRIDAPSSCSNTPGSINRLLWDYEFTSPGNLVGITKLSNGTTFTTTNVKFKVSGRSYAGSGSIVSRAFDVGFTTSSWLWNWSNLNATGIIPSSTTVSYATQTSSSSTGIFDTLINVSSGSSPTSTVREFIRYKASFASPGSTSPIINDISINTTSMLRPGATFFSQIKNAPSLTSWDTFIAGFSNNGGLNTFSIRSSSNSFTVQSTTPSWSLVSSGGIPNTSANPFFQIKDQIEISSYAALTNSIGPELDDFKQSWFEGTASDKAYATYFDDKIWWEVTSGNSSTNNNKTLIYDMLNQTWTIYDLAVNGFYVRQNRLYFGSSTGGYIYKFGDVDNDNGSAINAYWKSKDFFGGNPFTNQELANISLVAKEVATSSMTVTYSINGSSDVAYVVPLYQPNSLFINKNKNIPAGTTAGDFNVKFGNNAADQPFELFGIQVGIRPKSWVPN